MNYSEALEYIHSVSWTFCKPGLERIKELCAALGNPQDKLKFVHVAGTNGKGSVCAFLESILRAQGYKTGLFTSPYVRFFNERMAVNGEPIENDELAELTAFVKPFADKMTDKPTEFELITAIGFLYFAKHSCDIVVLETGMGGRLDATNIIKNPILSIITGISLDHVAFLGSTVEQIAFEKAGIIKNGTAVLFGGEDEKAGEVIRTQAAKTGARFYQTDFRELKNVETSLEGAKFDFGNLRNQKINLLGIYQPKNAATVLTAVEILRLRGVFISDKSVMQGLATTVWHARFEIVSKNPLIIFDGAHNLEGITAAVESIKKYFDSRVYVLTGVLKDKDYEAIAKAISTVASRAFAITPDNPRALSAKEYARILMGYGVSAESFDSMKEAFVSAKNTAQKRGIPLVCLGSLYTYGTLMDIIENE
ncbi:MAG: bifunctional folylpolyglutamate synthase/dihydrofolate synthase [Clostridia bacterium]|nr:bifunctional folylpolyglutamate synthase/dihydrofolate synthase [Clostridia bacterium]